MALEPLGDRSCVVVVDVQERYRGSSDAPMERGVAELLLRARSAGLDIVHVLHDIQADNLVKGNPMLEMVAKTHAQGYGDHHCVPLPCAWPLEGEHVVMKRTFDSFFRTGLHALLRQLGVGHIFVCGLLTGVCVMSTTFSAFARGFEVTIITDATTDGDARRAELLRDVYPLVAREQTVAQALPPARPDLRLPPRQNLDVHDPIVEAGPPLDGQRPEKTVLIIVNATPLYCNPLELRKLEQLADRFARAGGRVIQVHTETSRECPAAVAHELLTGQAPETQPAPRDAVAIRGSGILGDPDALKLPGVGQLALAGATASLHLPRTVLDGFNRGYWVLLVRDHLFDPSDHIERVQPAVASYDGQLCETVSVADLLGMA